MTSALSPRYMAAHILFPSILRGLGAPRVLDAIEAGGPSSEELFGLLWAKCGFRFTPRFLHATQGMHRWGVLTFPKPREMADAYMGLVVGKPDTPAFCRYFTWELSIHFGDPSIPATVLGSWTNEAHVNLGAGPTFTGDFEKDARTFASAALLTLEE